MWAGWASEGVDVDEGSALERDAVFRGLAAESSERHTEEWRGVLWEGVTFPVEHPYLQVCEPSARPRNHNAYVHEDLLDVLRRPHAVPNVPPRTPPFEGPALEMECALPDHLLPQTPADYWIRDCPVSGHFARVTKFSGLLTAAFAKREEAMRLRPNGPWRFDRKPFKAMGCEFGIFIHAREAKRRFRPFTFDMVPYLRGEPGPLRQKALCVDPQLFTTLNLSFLAHDFVRRAYSDASHFVEAEVCGFNDRSCGPRHFFLCVPSPSLFDPDNFATMQTTMGNKRAATPPKLSPAFPLPLTMPAHSCPKGMNRRWHDDKARCISDMGGGRTFGPEGEPGWRAPNKDTPSPVSINGRTNVHDTLFFPAAPQMRMATLGNQIDILGTVSIFCEDGVFPLGLTIDQDKDDMSGAYEQAGRFSGNHGQQHQMSSSAGWEIDSQLVFGGAGCVNTFSRFQTGLVWNITARVREASAHILTASLARLGLCATEPLQWLGAGIDTTTEFAQVPPHLSDAETPDGMHRGCIEPECLFPLLSWMRVRHSLHQPADWFTIGGMIDDTASYKFRFISAVFRRVQTDFMAQANVIMADGTADTAGALGPAGVLKK